ncbi:hypothetical protein SJZ84_08920 [Hafnia paralvei]|uniref:hypothetical protein n=1 Tax=Hafnia paralvei TaxID=546367 RepID=UPI0026DBA7C0|nr:hypothetical protein [Hafnia paralvei]MDX6910948.1 hypothetical protein [Hafnia paralvei]
MPLLGFGVFQRMFGYVAVTLSACWEKPLVIECDQKRRTSETVISWLAAIRNYDLLFMMLTKNKGKKRIKTTLFLPSGMIERQALQG